MKIVYSFVIYIYWLLIWITHFFNKKAKLWIYGRKNFWSKVKLLTIPQNKKVVFIHVSSLGEFEQGRQLIEEIKKNFSNTYIVLTFFSPSGYEIRKNYQLADAILYLPLDTKSNAKKFYDIFRPNLVVFVKYDFWYHFIFEAYKRYVPIYLISAVFKKQDVFFKWYGRFFNEILKLFTKIYTQDEHSKFLLEKNNINAVIAGDTRCDRVIEISKTASVPHEIEDLIKDRKVVVAGSVWLNDIKVIKNVIRQHNQIFWILVPHDISICNINRIIHELKISAIKYSELKSNDSEMYYTNVLIIDNVGMLSSLYKIAHVAYIGGGFNKGIHNILEPTVFGIPVIFGKKYHKFNEAIDMIQINAAFFIENENDANKIFNELLNNNSYREIAGIKAKKYIESKAGATKHIINDLNKFLS